MLVSKEIQFLEVSPLLGVSKSCLELYPSLTLEISIQLFFFPFLCFRFCCLQCVLVLLSLLLATKMCLSWLFFSIPLILDLLLLSNRQWWRVLFLLFLTRRVSLRHLSGERYYLSFYSWEFCTPALSDGISLQDSSRHPDSSKYSVRS